MDVGLPLYTAALCILACRLAWPALRVGLWLALVAWYVALPAAP